MGYPPTRIELLTAPAGVAFESCRSRAVMKELFGVAIPVIGLDDLILNKRAAGRPKDSAWQDRREQGSAFESKSCV